MVSVRPTTLPDLSLIEITLPSGKIRAKPKAGVGDDKEKYNGLSI